MSFSLLQQCELFESATPEELQLVYSFSQVKRFRANEMIYEEGSAGDSLLILLEGSVRVLIGEQEIDQDALIGTTYGETGFLENLPRSASLFAISDTQMLVIPSKNLWELIRQNSKFGIKFLTNIASRAGKRLRKSAHRLAEKSRQLPHSEYHLDAKKLDQEISGTIIGFDLKCSQLLKNQTGLACDPAEVLNRAVFPFRLLLAEYRGIEFSFQGDGVLAFFPDERISAEQILNKVVPHFIQIRDNVSTLLKTDGITPSHWDLNYRVAIVRGILVPTIHQLKNEEKAIWREGRDSPLTALANLFEIEKNVIDPEKNHTTISLSSLMVQHLVSAGVSQRVFLHEWVQRFEPTKHGERCEFYFKRFFESKKRLKVA